MGIGFLEGKCAHCGTTLNLTFDHKDPSTKSYNILRALRWKSKKELIKELEKCQALCKDCHKIKTINEGAQNIGERNGGAKLSNSNILEIRNDKRSLRKIARDYGVSHVTILKIKKGKSWGHIGG